MTQTMKRASIFGLILFLIVTIVIPLNTAHAVSQDLVPQEDLRENSWRFSNGVLTNPSDTEAVNGSSGALSPFANDTAQSRSVSFLKPMGIDVSRYQETIDWAKVSKSKVEFAIISCGYGNDFESQDDRQWLNNVRGCQKNDIQFGVYIYSYAVNVEMAKSEARHVVHALERAGLTPQDIQFPIYYDLEHEYVEGQDLYEDYKKLTPDDYNAMWLAFKKVLNDAGYTKVGIYANAEWWKNRLNKISIDSDYIWYARYGSNDPDKPLQPTDDPFAGYPSLSSKGLGVWQYSSFGKIDGISGYVDMNYCRSDLPFYTPKGTMIPVYRAYDPRTGEHLFTKDVNEFKNVKRWGWNDEGIAWYATSSGTPIYRAYNPRTGEHLYTKDVNEFNTLKRSGWNDEGIAWYTPSSGTPIYRAYNPRTGEHMYTKDANEFNTLKRSGWNDEGIAWYGSGEGGSGNVVDTPSPSLDKVTIYRAYNPRSGEHLYTKDVNEFNTVKRNGWNDEGIAWYATSSGTPIYRAYNSRTGEHLFTQDVNEFNTVKRNGWNDEGIAWYAPSSGTPIYRAYNPRTGEHLYTKDVNEFNTVKRNGWNDEGVAWYGA